MDHDLICLPEHWMVLARTILDHPMDRFHGHSLVLPPPDGHKLTIDFVVLLIDPCLDDSLLDCLLQTLAISARVLEEIHLLISRQHAELRDGPSPEEAVQSRRFGIAIATHKGRWDLLAELRATRARVQPHMAQLADGRTISWNH